MEVEVETYPEIELKKYKGLKIEKVVYKIDDSDVDEQIELIRKQKATVIPIEDAAQEGHFVTIDLQELDQTGMPLVGKKYNDMRIELGKGSFDLDIERQLLDVKVKEDKIVEKRYPKNTKSEPGTKNYERFKVSVKRVEREELPEIDDDFVKDLNIEIESVQELRERVKSQLEYDWGQRSEQHFYNQFAHELLQENSFEVPESMVSRYLDQIVAEISNKEKNVNIEEVRTNYRVDALFNIKWYHLKEKIAEVENIKAEENDFSEYLKKIEDKQVRERYKTNEELKKRILNDIYEKKIFDFLVANSKVTVKEQSIKKRKEVEAV
jgi:trigger factor